MLPNDNGCTPVHSAARNGHLDVVKCLAALGADIKAADNSGDTPIDSAACNGHFELVNFLGE